MPEVNGHKAHKNGKHKNGADHAMGFEAPYPSSPQRAPTPSPVKSGEPTGREVIFGVEDMLVSKTDLKGHVTYANEAFLKVAGYSEEELVGQPHNVIRHPDMPRCVFDLLWKTIQGGKEIFAYVVNLCKSGDHYWVLAHVTPTFDERGAVVGYHSNRRYADPQAVAKVKQLYQRLCNEERNHARRADAIEASTRLLERTLADAGLKYDEFIFSL